MNIKNLFKKDGCLPAPPWGIKNLYGTVLGRQKPQSAAQRKPAAKRQPARKK
jgi:hypothetical protein